MRRGHHTSCACSRKTWRFGRWFGLERSFCAVKVTMGFSPELESTEDSNVGSESGEGQQSSSRHLRHFSPSVAGAGPPPGRRGVSLCTRPRPHARPRVDQTLVFGPQAARMPYGAVVQPWGRARQHEARSLKAGVLSQVLAAAPSMTGLPGPRTLAPAESRILGPAA